jgi:sulfur carrier protein ThiS
MTEVMGKENVLECPKGSVKDLIGGMLARYGSAANMIFDQSGTLDHSIQVVINDREYVKPQDFEKILIRDGDVVTFMMLIAGG